MSCTGGVFMENYQSSYGVTSRWLRTESLIYPCNAVAEKYKYYCYDLVTARILPKVNYNWKKAAAWCRKSEKNWVKVCFQSMGRDASGFTRLDPARILRICHAAGNMARECIYAAAEDMTYTDVSARRAKALCNTAPAATQELLLDRDRRDPRLAQPRGGEAQGELRRGDEHEAAYREACYRGAAVTLDLRTRSQSRATRSRWSATTESVPGPQLTVSR